MIGSHVGPGLWSAAEAQVLIVSANLPLMGPIVQRLRGKYRTLSDRAGKDEKGSKILELSATKSSGKRGLTHSTPLEAGNAAFDTFATGTPKTSKTMAGTAFTDNEILVELNLEQRVHRV